MLAVGEGRYNTSTYRAALRLIGASDMWEGGECHVFSGRCFSMKLGPDQSEGRESELRLLGPEQITGRGRSGDAPHVGLETRMSRLQFRRGIC